MSDFTKIEDVIKLMRSSCSEKEWNANCDRVKEANQGYPDWWYKEIIIAGVHLESQAKWGSN